MRTIPSLFLMIGLFLIQNSATAQEVDHWETVVFAEDDWHYRLGYSEPPSNWMEAQFNESVWSVSMGGFGYGDGDDNTLISSGSFQSIYIRRKFDLIDIDEIEQAILHADYDDGFVAYLNGVEIARDNMDGSFPAYNANTITDHEAQLYQGNQPTPFAMSKEKVVQFLQTGSNILAIQIHNVDFYSSDFSSNFFFSVGVNVEKMQYAPTPDWFVAPFHDSNLPIIKISTNGLTIPDEPKVVAHMGIVDNGPGNRNAVFTDDNNGYNGQIYIEARGASSQFFFPKKGYGFETQDEDGNNNNVELLGMPEENDWILHGPYSDKTLIRNVLMYHLGRGMDQWAPRTRFCELFLNENYQGIYVLMEKIKRDENRVDIAKLTSEDNVGDELTGGYIVQVDREELGNSWISPYSPNPAIVYQHPNADDLTSSQENYIRQHITDFEDNLRSNNFDDPDFGYNQFINVGSFIDHILAIELARDVDGYRLSSFLHKDKDSNGGKIVAGPLWDFNLGFGNADYCDGVETTGWVYDDRNCGNDQPFWWDRLLEDENFRNQMSCRWDELRSGVWQTQTILDFIDSQATLLDETQARNFNRWPVIGSYVWPNPFVGRTYHDEIDYLKRWTTSRLDWMDANMPGDCFLSSIDDLRGDFELLVNPNPFEFGTEFILNGSNDLIGGEIQIFDTYGTEVRNIELIDPIRTYWDGTNSKGVDLPSGMYFYLLSKEGENIHSGKISKM